MLTLQRYLFSVQNTIVIETINNIVSLYNIPNTRRTNNIGNKGSTGFCRNVDILKNDFAKEVLYKEKCLKRLHNTSMFDGLFNLFLLS